MKQIECVPLSVSGNNKVETTGQKNCLGSNYFKNVKILDKKSI